MLTGIWRHGKVNIICGKEYAFREVRGCKSPLQHIKVIEHLRHNKWKAKWIEPNPGLIDYVESAQIIVPWRERKAFLWDEENAAGLIERNKADGFQPKSPTTEAVQQVFESVGDEVDFYRHELPCSQESLARLRARADDQSGTDSLAGYPDRTGRVHWPLAPALELARKFCAAEPSTVLKGIEAMERQWSMESSRPGGEYLISLLNQYRASWAIIRQWTGLDPAIVDREGTHPETRTARLGRSLRTPKSRARQ